MVDKVYGRGTGVSACKGAWGELERGGERGGERLGSGIDVLLGDHGTDAPGILATLLDPIPPVGGGLVNPETNGGGRRGRKVGRGKPGGGRGEGMLLASKRRGHSEQADRPACRLHVGAERRREDR